MASAISISPRVDGHHVPPKLFAGTIKGMRFYEPRRAKATKLRSMSASRAGGKAVEAALAIDPHAGRQVTEQRDYQPEE